MVATGFTSCTKDATEKKITVSAASKNLHDEIPIYSSPEEMLMVLQGAMEAKEKSLDDLICYEESQGRVSIGRLADVFYRDVDPDMFKSEEEEINFIRDNSFYLDTLHKNEDINVVPRFADNFYRYVANPDGLFIIGDSIYRVFKHGLVWTDVEHKNELKSSLPEGYQNWTLEELLEWYRSSHSIIKIFVLYSWLDAHDTSHDKCCRKKSFEGECKKGKNKLEFGVYVYEKAIAGPLKIGVMFKARTYKKGVFDLFFWAYERKITLKGSFDIHSRSEYWNDNDWDITPIRVNDLSRNTDCWRDDFHVFSVNDYKHEYVHLKRNGHMTAETSEAGSVTLVFN